MTAPPAPPRPAPDLHDPLYADHIAGLRVGSLVAQRCGACSHVQWPPRHLCLVCRSADLGAADMPLDGVVYTYTVCHRAFHPWFASKVPFAIVVAAVGQGVRFVGGYGGDLDGLTCGLPVSARTEWVDDVAYLVWAPAGEP